MKQLILLFSAFAVALCSCDNSRHLVASYGGDSSGSSRKMRIEDGSPNEYLNLRGSMASVAGEPYVKGNNDEQSKKMVIYNASFNLAVKEPDSAKKKIEKITADFGGYIQSAGTYKFVLRIKSASMNPAIEAISKLGKVSAKDVYADDVTESYFDLSIRLDNAEKARKRYLELLARAQNVDEALKVEKELERLNRDIDLLKGKLNKMENLAEYSTITVYVNEKVKPGIIGYIGIGVYKFVKWFFVRN